MFFNKKTIVLLSIVFFGLVTKQVNAGAIQSGLAIPHKAATTLSSLTSKLDQINKKKLVKNIVGAAGAIYIAKNKDHIKNDLNKMKEKVLKKVKEKLWKMTKKALKEKLINTGENNLKLAIESFASDLIKNMAEINEL